MALNPLLVVLLPLAYILVACFISMQFSVVLHFIGQAGIHIKRVPQLAPAEPVVTAIVDYFHRIFGNLSKFTPQPTHVLLVSILVAVVVMQQTRRK